MPRTIRTLSPLVQAGIDAAEYEVIVVDNGSTEPFPESECRRWVPNLIVHRMVCEDAGRLAGISSEMVYQDAQRGVVAEEAARAVPVNDVDVCIDFHDTRRLLRERPEAA